MPPTAPITVSVGIVSHVVQDIVLNGDRTIGEACDIYLESTGADLPEHPAYFVNLLPADRNTKLKQGDSVLVTLEVKSA